MFFFVGFKGNLSLLEICFVFFPGGLMEVVDAALTRGGGRTPANTAVRSRLSPQR